MMQFIAQNMAPLMFAALGSQKNYMSVYLQAVYGSEELRARFEAAYQAFIMDDRVRDFMAEKNAPALTELADRFIEAIDRGLWKPKSNSARFRLEDLT